MIGDDNGGGETPPIYADWVNAVLEEVTKRNEQIAPALMAQTRAVRHADALRSWRTDGNPIGAMEALATWDRSNPLPDDLAGYVVASASTFIEQIAGFATFDEKAWKLADGSKALADSFGFKSGKTKGSNPFARYRDQSLGYKAAQAYLENCHANPAMKSDDIIRFMARRAKLSEAQMRRHIKTGLKFIGIKAARKRDARSIKTIFTP
ncbi:hypothetical protein AruPA_02685 [Acidiphilium sp. PA]|uniref:hypothetical protein n=1 Tax=Acidiphilium sp. PA TaxID=2871705 RepID=UPI002243BDA2|nr:hypothetical protein [Acidiphilium sp. PA]MCW8305930.1 hypothetical protein [Acidiphilium sp. PA]